MAPNSRLNIIARIRQVRFTEKSPPWVLLAALVLAFGLLIPGLGFYYDDWHFIYYATHGAQGLIDLFNYDGHPTSVWLYILAFKLVGYSPLAWHLLALVLRWLAVAVFWLCFKRTWPGRSRQTFTAALLFAIYPLFTLQALPISYFEVWLGFFLLGLSFFFTIEALRRPDRFWLFTALAILAKAGNAMTSEYTWGAELMRPFFIWFMLGGGLSTKQKLRETLKLWAPYLLIFIGMLGWRIFLYSGGRKAFQAQVSYLASPLAALAALPRTLFPDLGLILFTSWYPLFDPRYLDPGDRTNLALALLMVLSGAGLYFFLDKFSTPEENPEDEGGWRLAFLVTGLAGLVFGLIPSYGAGYGVYATEAPINSRLALGALPGAALVLTAVLDALITRRGTRLFLIALLGALLIGWHARYTLDFRKDWSAQVSFFRQLSWRAPGLKPGTALITNAGIFPPREAYPARVATEGDFPTAMALNALYPARGTSTQELAYWYLPDVPAGQGTTIEGEHAGAKFSGAAGNALVFTFAPPVGECLHILNPQVLAYRRLPDELRQFEPTTLGIETAPAFDASLMGTILGVDNRETWCYFYEKADLAWQAQDWPGILVLWSQADSRGLRPENGLEYLPFLDAFMHASRWADALSLSKSAGKNAPAIADVLCPLWQKTALAAQTAEAQNALKDAQSLLKCQK